MEPGGAGEDERTTPGSVVQIDEGRIKAHLDQVMRATVEKTLNALLDAEADQLCGAKRCERTEARQDTRAGSYERQLHTRAGEVTLKVPKLGSLSEETPIFDGY
jgi:transposase-like protein